jgi:hypothetical protein
MFPPEPAEEPPEKRRRAIFLALADAQDLHELSPLQARQLIARRFGLSEARVREIEREGRERLWPPL